MNTVLLLMAKYSAAAVVPIDLVYRDYLSHLKLDHLVRKVKPPPRGAPIAAYGSSTIALP
ncbi:pyocin activator PrtN family protein [Burkholderia sp. Ac-20353]|uniref:pyocin activator PrtN family protein n=1 Tax=Burkholderia sp. Ac-20353 TaxID=2703894 RepID=UPI00197BB915|nr:pyocin activator PrtN family protein [Burkholderia sp. Ac-20353]MBN3789705.1 hypothetical protein [Burkholderia sp. Ac-20353]